MKHNKFLKKLKIFFENQEGLTMVEYAIGTAVIAGAALSFFSLLGDAFVNLVSNIVTTLDTAGGSGGA